MRKLLLTSALLLATAAALFVVANWCLPGRFSYCNFERIAAGMKLSDVESLLGASGMEITAEQLPGIVDWSVPVDSPQRIKGAISGEKFYLWEDGTRYILVSLKADIVHEKWYWEPSL